MLVCSAIGVWAVDRRRRLDKLLFRLCVVACSTLCGKCVGIWSVVPLLCPESLRNNVDMCFRRSCVALVVQLAGLLLRLLLLFVAQVVLFVRVALSSFVLLRDLSWL